MSLTSMWIHSNAVVVETPENLGYTKHVGWGVNFGLLNNTQTWLHIPIPTPTLSNDVHLELQKVYLLFQTDHPDTGGTIHAVHVYDGETTL